MKRKLVVNNDFQGINKAFQTKEFGELLEDAYTQGNRETKETKKEGFAPSKVGYGNGNCPRYWYYAFNGAEFEYTNDALSMANMNYGTEAGKRIAGLLETAGILIEAEKEVKHDDPPIGGFMDAMVEWQGEEIICEIKTTRQDSFNIRQAKMKAPGYQLIQLLTYMKVFEKDKGFFLVENKNTGELLVIPIKMNDAYRKLIDDVWDWMRMVHKNAMEGELPKRPFYSPKSKPCNECEVAKTCWAGFNRAKKEDPNPGTIELPVLEIEK